MKINVEFDLTPDEFRRSLGLPDVEAFQKDLLERIQTQMESGVDGYDPMSLMQPFLQQPGLGQGLSQGLSQGLANFGSYQQMMLDMLGKAASASRNQSSADAAQPDDEARSGKSSAAGTSAQKSKAGRASATSRNSGEKSSRGTRKS
ncbi:hypothetical protein [Halomonas halocynthiae]|uniref:hypothetical protein n=1 Tax=Halomonas halocynthiae TaxID=176290 RepID=UPI000684C461|nr:hypothetical protein [Halomonas halocynthiae]